jgi:hypothetical protein
LTVGKVKGAGEFARWWIVAVVDVDVEVMVERRARCSVRWGVE